MTFNRKLFRIAITALLVAPVIPLALFATARSRYTGAGAACATGAGCSTCSLSSCVLASGESLQALGEITFTRCVNYDQTPTGHCAVVTYDSYSIVNSSGNSVGSCYKSNCLSSVIYDTRICDNPLNL